MADSPLRRLYLFSDTYGRSKNPFDQDDADVLLCTDFRSLPLRERRREFDIYGRERVVQHMIRLTFDLHAGVRKATYLNDSIKEEFEKTYTGVFINAAPRTDTKQNGAPFYLATAENIRIVTTDLTALSSVRDRIETLSRLPNEDNNLYGPTEQFRSSYAPRLLYPEHGLTMIEESTDIIPKNDPDWWELCFVDRFGNMITYVENMDKAWAGVEKAAKEQNGSVKLIIGNVSQRVLISTSLKDAEPGALVLYPNGDNLDIVHKWGPDEDRYTRLYQSAYSQFAKPEIGDKVRVRD